jgi:hypothetical protein
MMAYYCSQIGAPKILEIGIFRGEFFDFIAQSCNPGVLDGVDLFEGITCSGNADGNDVVHYDVGQSFLELVAKYRAAANINLHKSDSSTFLNNCADSYYDIVYIDGDHSYAGVKRDLESALRKVKNGGYIMGHDYEMNMNKARNVYDFGVKRAVDEFCAKHKLPIIAKGLDGCVSFCIQVLH